MLLETLDPLLAPPETVLDREYFTEWGRVVAYSELEIILMHENRPQAEIIILIKEQRAQAEARKGELAKQIDKLNAANNN